MQSPRHVNQKTVVIQSPLIAAVRSLIQRLRQFQKSGPKPRLQLIESLPLGGKRQLLLVSCDGEDFLVGAGADAVSTITPISPRGPARFPVPGEIRGAVDGPIPASTVPTVLQ